MFFKLLLRVLKRLSPERAEIARGVLEGKSVEIIENKKADKLMKAQAKAKKKKEKKENKKMAEEVKDKKPEVDEKETKSTETVEKTEETKTEDMPADTEAKSNNSKPSENTNADNNDNGEGADESQDPVVQSEDAGSVNAIPLTDIVTVDMLNERFDALAAKFDAVIKENADLKERIGKYENEDFGNVQKQGVQTKDKDANDVFEETFESYSAQFK